MTAFIMQEAMEKAREIEIKANEEFALEKARLVRQEKDAIDAMYEKKCKQAIMAQQTARSAFINKARLRVLSVRQDLVDDVFAKAEKRLREGSQDKEAYQRSLSNILLEGLLAMGEPEVRVRARTEDYDLVGKAIEVATKGYKDKTGEDVVVSIAESDPLPDET